MSNGPSELPDRIDAVLAAAQAEAEAASGDPFGRLVRYVESALAAMFTIRCGEDSLTFDCNTIERRIRACASSLRDACVRAGFLARLDPIAVARKADAAVGMACGTVTVLDFADSEELLSKWRGVNERGYEESLGALFLVFLYPRGTTVLHTLRTFSLTYQAAEQPDVPQQPGQDRSPVIDPEANAIALLYLHEDWSVTRIAEELNVNRQTLYKWVKFCKAAELAGRLNPRGTKERTPRRGHKTRDGRVEAYQEAEDEDD